MYPSPSASLNAWFPLSVLIKHELGRQSVTDTALAYYSGHAQALQLVRHVLEGEIEVEVAFRR